MFTKESDPLNTRNPTKNPSSLVRPQPVHKSRQPLSDQLRFAHERILAGLESPFESPDDFGPPQGMHLASSFLNPKQFAVRRTPR